MFSSWPGLTRPSRSGRQTLGAGSPGYAARPGEGADVTQLLQLDLGADLLEGRLDLLGLVLADALLDGLRRTLDEVLGLFEAEARDGADFLDDLDLLVADAGEDDRELGLLLGGRSGGAGSRAGRNRDGGGGGDAPLLLEELRELGGLENGQRRQVVDDLGKISHGFDPSVCSVR